MNGIIFLVFFSIALVIYMTPGLVASYRKHRNANAIAVLNLFLGWTFVGWVVALVWSFTDQSHA